MVRAKLQLNCDMGESYGRWNMGNDKDVMPHIQMANIACGFHAGDASVMRETIALAKQYDVAIGAHVGYEDKQGFGRRNMSVEPEQLIDQIHYQISALMGLAACQDAKVSYVKPHGALYNQMMREPEVMSTTMLAMASYHVKLPLMIQATKNAEHYTALADNSGISLLFEAFADRAYLDNGLLKPRAEAHSVHSAEAAIEQGKALIQSGEITTESGKRIALQVDTLCIHGDSPDATRISSELAKVLADC